MIYNTLAFQTVTKTKIQKNPPKPPKKPQTETDAVMISYCLVENCTKGCTKRCTKGRYKVISKQVV